MCGIAGYLGKRTLDRRIIRRTLDLMKNRGPDNQPVTAEALDGRPQSHAYEIAPYVSAHGLPKIPYSKHTKYHAASLWL